MSYVAPSLVVKPSAQPGAVLTVNALSTNQVELVVSEQASSPAGPVAVAALSPQDINALITALISAATAVAPTLSGTATVTNGNATVTFSAAQTLPAGTMLVFSVQPGVVYFLSAAVNAGTSGTLTTPYGGTGSTTATTNAF